MKISLKIVLVLFSLFILGGCSKIEEINKDEIKPNFTCSLVQSENDYKTEGKIFIYADGEYVSKIISEETLNANNSEVLKNFEKTYKTMYDSLNKKFGGYTYDIKSEGGTVVSNLEMDYTKMNTEAYAYESSGLIKYLENGKIRIKGIIEMYESLGASC